MNIKYILRVWGLFVLFCVILFFPFVLPVLQGVKGAALPSPFIFWGILSYAFMAYDVILGARLAFFEKGHGLPDVYLHHGLLGFGAIISAIVHSIYSIMRESHTFDLSVTQLLGYFALVLLILIIFSGMFMLSSEFIRKSKFWMRLKERVFNREVGLFMHRFAFASTLFMFWHIIITRAASNVWFKWAMIFTFALTMLIYAASKTKRILAPKFVLEEIESLPGRCYHLVFTAQNGKTYRYGAGQYVFVRFVESALPRESHPFSFASYPADTQSGFSVMVKEAGDYTDRISKLKKGDIAKIEGPYGTFLYGKKNYSDIPLVLIGGGIGITPMISILGEMLVNGHKQKLIFIWAVNKKDEIFYQEHYEELAKMHDNFSYHIALADEQIEGYSHGFVNEAFLQKSGALGLPANAEFYLCGPLPMMISVEKILRSNNIPKKSIHAEKFTF